MNRLGDYIKSLRQRRDLRQIPLAKALGISISTYGAIERGTVQPDRSQILKICNYYEMDGKEFLTNVYGRSEITDKLIQLLIKVVKSNIAK